MVSCRLTCENKSVGPMEGVMYINPKIKLSGRDENEGGRIAIRMEH